MPLLLLLFLHYYCFYCFCCPVLLLCYPLPRVAAVVASVHLAAATFESATAVAIKLARYIFSRCLLVIGVTRLRWSSEYARKWVRAGRDGGGGRGEGGGDAKGSGLMEKVQVVSPLWIKKYICNIFLSQFFCIDCSVMKIIIASPL